MAQIRGLASEPTDSADQLTAVLKSIHETIATLDLAGSDPVVIRESVPEAMAVLDDVYFDLRDRLRPWHADGLLNVTNQALLREVFRVMRFGKDMLGEIWVDHERIEDKKHTLRAFTGTHLNTNVHPDFRHHETIAFQSGDVILMRGQHHNSAAISMIGDVDSQFSHLALVYIDPYGKHWIVESLIETGAHVVPLEKSLSAGAGRAIVFRHRDRVMAAEAAKIMFDRVAASVDGRDPKILYDFSMRLDGGRKLFCSKLVRQAYKAASEKALMLPTFQTVLGMKNRDFFNRIGVKARHTFVPGDMEIEPEFDIVAEWRDYRVTSRLRLQDIVMAKFFEWMDTRGYVFQETLTIRLISWFGRLSGQLSDTAKNLIEDVIPRVPSNMKRRTIATVAMLHRSADPVVKALEEIDVEAIRESGLGMHPSEVRDHLEELRHESGGNIGYLRPMA